MRDSGIILLLLILLVGCNSPANNTVENTKDNPEDISFLENSEYSAELAKKAGADEYGMKTYVMAFLKSGPNRDLSPEEANELQRQHLDNIGRMAEEGKLVMAGPFMHDGDLRGIYIFDVETVEEAKSLTESDPAIKAGSLVMDLVPWYGSAGLVFMGDLHQKLAKKEI